MQDGGDERTRDDQAASVGTQYHYHGCRGNNAPNDPPQLPDGSAVQGHGSHSQMDNTERKEAAIPLRFPSHIQRFVRHSQRMRRAGGVAACALSNLVHPTLPAVPCAPGSFLDGTAAAVAARTPPGHELANVPLIHGPDAPPSGTRWRRVSP